MKDTLIRERVGTSYPVHSAVCLKLVLRGIKGLSLSDPTHNVHLLIQVKFDIIPNMESFVYGWCP